MKYAVLAFCAVVAVAIASESATMPETTELIQEHAAVEAKTMAKVGAMEGVAAKAGSKAGAKAGGEAKATIMIGTHEVDAEAVYMARAQVHKLQMKMGARHPIFLGETAGIADFIQNDARYVKGGYKRLEKILKKIDEFEAELVTEKGNWEEARFTSLQGCDADAKTHSDRTVLRTQEQADKHTETRAHAAKIVALKGAIAQELNSETSNAGDVRSFIDDVAGKFNTYWNNAEERHQVRNVLMQALWLVCTGFANFRHTEYCTNIRQQPDFDEPAIKQPTAEAMTLNDGPSKLAKIIKHSTTFGQTMQPVWEQQKVADRSTVNSLDGDVDMEKGFVNNKAPWGVDPAGMSARVGGEEELGESNESQDMTNEEMSSRLSFLLESSAVPERIASPINAFIQALDSNDVAVQGGLVAALVDMDTQEGQSQSTLDYQWY